MESKPTLEVIAKAAKMTVDEVGTYKCHEQEIADGSWLIGFGNETPEKLKGGLSSQLTVVIPAKRSAQ